MSLACVLVTHLPIKSELQRQPDLAGKPAIIVKKLGSKDLVLDYSPQAKSIVPGMPLREAVSISKDATLLEADESFYQAAFDEILDSLEQRSPLVEGPELGCAYVGLEGLEALYGGETRLITSLLCAVHPAYNPRVGVAEGKFPAYIAAVGSTAGQATKVQDDAADFLRKVPINLLSISWENRDRLSQLGLVSLGDIAAQTAGAMQAQFGREGLTAWELARGIDRRPLIPRQPQQVITECLTFPSPVVTLPGILLAAESLLIRAFSRPEVRGRYIRSVNLESHILHHPPWVKTFYYKQAVGSKDRALAVIKHSLESLALPGPLEDMKLTLTGLTGESGVQTNLFSDVREQEQLREAIRQLRVRWGGETPIYQARTFEPWSPIPEKHTILVPYDS